MDNIGQDGGRRHVGGISYYLNKWPLKWLCASAFINSIIKARSHIRCFVLHGALLCIAARCCLQRQLRCALLSMRFEALLRVFLL